MLLGSSYHEHSKSLVAFMFGKSWNVSVDVCSITNAFLMLCHTAKGAQIINVCVTRYTCIFVNESNFPQKNMYVNFDNALST